jgi:hypothetical protein
MQQRRLRLGDIVDDYCPRERRITNHAIVAMIEEQVKQTRCTTCDADHEYKQARIPAQRRKKEGAAALVDAGPGTPRKRGPEVPDLVEETEPISVDEPLVAEFPKAASPAEPVAAAPPSREPTEPADSAEPEEPQPAFEDDGPVHRRLIRATLPRVEGQTPERKVPEFTIHQRETNGNRAGRGPRRGPRPGQARSPHSGGQQRFGGGQHQGPGHSARPQGSGPPSRHGSGPSQRHGSGQPPRHGSGHGGQGEHGGNRGPGQHRQNRPGGGGSGRKRGR